MKWRTNVTGRTDWTVLVDVSTKICNCGGISPNDVDFSGLGMCDFPEVPSH
jgi:hypothetical protein